MTLPDPVLDPEVVPITSYSLGRRIAVLTWVIFLCALAGGAGFAASTIFGY